MDIIVLLFVISLLIIDSNIRQRMFAALAAAVNLRQSIDVDSSTDDTEHNIDETSNDNAIKEDNDTITVSDDAIDAVARLVAANVVSATRACQIAFNVSARGNAAVYRAVRQRAAALKQSSTTSHNDEIVDIRSDGRVIRSDAHGKYYVVYANGRKEFINMKEVNV